MGQCSLDLEFSPLQPLKFRIEPAERTPWGNCPWLLFRDNDPPSGPLKTYSRNARN